MEITSDWPAAIRSRAQVNNEQTSKLADRVSGKLADRVGKLADRVPKALYNDNQKRSSRFQNLIKS